MNKTRNTLLIAGAGLLVIAGLAVAQAVVTPYTATEIPIMLNLWQPGTTTNPDGQTHIRDMVVITTRQPLAGPLDPRVSGGTFRATLNFNLGRDLSGPVWGTGHWELGDGVWDGALVGNSNMATHVGYYDAVWHGEGKFRGLQLKETCVYTGSLIGTCTGRILQMNNN